MTVSVFHNADDVVEVDGAWIAKLTEAAAASELKRARLCLHRASTDPLHEMVIVFHRDTLVQPHRHHGKSESFHLIFGELDIILFDDDGVPFKVVRMGSPENGRTPIYRLDAPVWHSVVVRTEYAAIHEVTNGPFVREEGDFASWAPEGPGALRSFLANAITSLQRGNLDG